MPRIASSRHGQTFSFTGVGVVATVLAALLTLTGPAVTSPTHASSPLHRVSSVTSDPEAGLYVVECAGALDATIVQTFNAQHLDYRVPLRCGGGYGYRHIHDRRGGYGLVLEAHISSCLANPITPIEMQGTTLKYNCYVVPSDYGPEVFYGTAIVQTAAYQDGQPKGLITYYESQVDLGDV